MIGEALHRKVKGDLRPMIATGGEKTPKVFKPAELRMDGLVPTRRRPDGIETARIIGFSTQPTPVSPEKKLAAAPITIAPHNGIG